MTNLYLFRIAILSGFVAAHLTFMGASFAQPMNIIGHNTDARKCYLAAKYQRQTRKALKYCDDAMNNTLMKKRDRAAVLVNRGILRRMADDIQGAYSDYQSALSILPDLPEARANRANIYYLSGYFEKALSDYDFALAQDISDEKAVSLNRALVLAEMGRISEARKGLLDVTTRYPDWAIGQEKLSSFTKRHG